ncbi:leukocyte receptor cluster member 1 homolog [Saccostrea echinata]|uniref:leukocyte receptor cluster member 1 homolog n=1 Tax=Saccostrea echinata TaxID=191078 RepID=UPI002A80318D|nr:leukocyte receptor cluster member 1 homolog [Saccostrea echinata]
MNILHHKSWHVRNKDNIARVRRDEEKAALEEKERQRKIALAEQEARTEFLRQKSRKHLEESGKGEQVNDGKSVVSSESAVSTFGTGALSDDIYSGRHINFFKETDGMVVSDRKNAEHEAEKKAEQEDWEKKVGILTYLGQSSNETSASWYNQRKRKCHEEEEDDDYEKQKRREKNRKLQDHLDPIHQMNSYLDKKKGRDGKEKHKKHKKKKHKHDKDKSESKHKSNTSTPKKKSSVSMEQLRAERLKREMEERQRTAQLLAKHRGEKVETEVPERQQKYNSQYNPDFVRQPRRKQRD